MDKVRKLGIYTDYSVRWIGPWLRVYLLLMSKFGFGVSCWCDWRGIYHSSFLRFILVWWSHFTISAESSQCGQPFLWMTCVQTINTDMSKSVFFSSAAMATVCLDNSSQMSIISAPSASQMEAVIVSTKAMQSKADFSSDLIRSCVRFIFYRWCFSQLFRHLSHCKITCQVLWLCPNYWPEEGHKLFIEVHVKPWPKPIWFLWCEWLLHVTGLSASKIKYMEYRNIEKERPNRASYWIWINCEHFFH